MSKQSYQRLLRAKYNYLLKNKTYSNTDILDKIFSLPHPQRESAFVVWATKTKQEIPNIINNHNEKASMAVYT